MNKHDTVFILHDGRDFTCFGEVYKGYPRTRDMPEEMPYFEAIDILEWDGEKHIKFNDELFETIADLANNQWLTDMGNENV